MKLTMKRIMTLTLALMLCATLYLAQAESGKTIAPMANDIDVNSLPDGIYPVAFDLVDVQADEGGVVINNAHIFTRDWYDIVDVNTLEVGDSIIVEGEPVEVLTLTRDDFGIAVNEGQDARAFYLVTPEDSNGYTILGMNDLGTYTDHGATALTFDAAATFTDAWDIEKDPVTVDYDGIAEALRTTENDSFIADNTTVRVEAGKVVALNRAYMP